MKTRDTLRLAQTNLVRSKLRTSLTIIAVFIGALTLSLTNGVGNGAKAYINDQLNNIGMKNTFNISAKQPDASTPFHSSEDIAEYNPDKTVGMFDIAYLTQSDLDKIAKVDGINKVTPVLQLSIDYVTTGGKKLVITPSQFTEGLNVKMVAGRVVNVDSSDEVTMPESYLKALGFNSAAEAVGKTATFGYKNSNQQPQERLVKIVGVQQNALFAKDWFISDGLAKSLHQQMTEGIPSLANNFLAATAQFDVNFSQPQIDDLKQRIEKAGDYQAQTIDDQIGTISDVINTVQIALNIFGAIALLAASFGIVNTLLMAVNERTREIGLMKALGSSPRSIFTIFSVEAMSLGFWGSLLGVLASMGIGAIVNPLATNTFLKDLDGFNLLVFPALQSAGIIGLIMIIAFLAGALPSIKASRLNPIEALRYE